VIVTTLRVGEGAAFGAALQALWCWKRQSGDAISISEITDRFVKLNPRERTVPNPDRVAVYREVQALQNDVSQSLRNAFKRHRRLLRTL
jgi:sugar (pentulose or hexulose) kinase